jgi:hypothetical protein
MCATVHIVVCYYYYYYYYMIMQCVSRRMHFTPIVVVVCFWVQGASRLTKASGLTKPLLRLSSASMRCWYHYYYSKRICGVLPIK